LTLNAVVRHFLRKTLNAILEPSSLPFVVTQPDKRLQIEQFCVGSGIADAVHMNEREERLK